VKRKNTPPKIPGWLIKLFAWPAAYFLMKIWLDNFAYRTSLAPWVFVVTAFLSLAVALLTVSYKSIKAALSNPVDSLRYE